MHVAREGEKGGEKGEKATSQAFGKNQH